MSLVGISTLFLAFTYENKLIIASKDYKRILKPYSLTTDELRNTLINYKNSLAEDKILKLLYRSFIIISFVIILVWGSVVSFYTQFRFSFQIDLTIGSLLVFGVYSFFAILVIALLLLAIAIKLVRLNKDPLDNGYLPSTITICDIDHLIEKKGDLKEFFYINSPSLDFFKNPAGNAEKYELVFNLPIKVYNLRFTLKLYDSDQKSVALIYGRLTNELTSPDEVGDNYMYTLTTDLEKAIYDKLDNTNSLGILKIYNKEHKISAKYRCVYKRENDYNYRYMLHQKIPFDETTIDNDSNLLRSHGTENKIKYQNEIATSN
ncbi:hypothetical protein [Bacillus sp. JJ1474]|uniref:hypothetical protein n=1 Tax=Bacillus sp. JJ1474 TaxID=3122955 RepID=UPI002FFE7D08